MAGRAPLRPTLSCTRTEAIAAGASAPPLTLTVNVATNAPATVTNTATVSGGGDINLANNSDADPTTIGGEPDLTIEKTHTGNFTRGQTGTYTITVRNAGNVGTSGAITVTDDAAQWPHGYGVRRRGLDVHPASAPVHRAASRSPPARARPPLTLTVTVAANAPASVTNTATVSGGGESNTTNDTATDVATIVRRARPHDREDAYGQLHTRPDGRHVHDHGDQLRDGADKRCDHDHRRAAERPHGHGVRRHGMDVHRVAALVHAQRGRSPPARARRR